MEEDKELTLKAADRLARVLLESATDANLRTLHALAAELGVTALDGVPVLQFYEEARHREVERRLASGADHNMELVSEMKRLWDRTKRPPTP